MTEYFFDELDEVGQPGRPVPVADPANGPVTIGRIAGGSAPDVAVPPECRSVSREHAVIRLQGGRPVLADKSRFGTIVNGELIEGRAVELHHSDEIVFGLPADGWRVKFRVPSDSYTKPQDPLESLAVSEAPRQIRINRLVVEERLGDRAFRLLKFLADHRGNWYPVNYLIGVLWPDPDRRPLNPNESLSHYKREINDILSPHLDGQEAIRAAPYRGYQMKTRLDQ
jgi:DNA-binding winged helix-turn-helix (wHTH) protein